MNQRPENPGWPDYLLAIVLAWLVLTAILLRGCAYRDEPVRLRAGYRTAIAPNGRFYVVPRYPQEVIIRDQ